MATISELMEQFLACELHHLAAHWEAAGIRVWPYLRLPLFDELARRHGLPSERQSAAVRGYVREALARPSSLPRVARRYDHRRLQPAPLLFLSHSRHYAHGGQHVSPYTHHLLNALASDQYWDLQFSDAGRHHVDDGLERVLYLDALYQAAFKGYAVLHRWGRLRRSIRTLARDFARLCERELGFAPEPYRLDRTLWNALRVQRAWGDACERLLDRVRPRLIINVVHYNWPTLALTERAHRRGVPVAELQHGTVSPEHIAYNVRQPVHNPSLPDYFLSFGEFWSDMARGLQLPPARMPAIGFSWLENRMVTLARRPQKVLLVISQRAIGVELSQLAVEAARALAPQGWRVVYRLHSGELADYRTRLPWLLRAPLEISTGSLDLYRQFGEAAAQLGVYSTALFEGVAFSLPTFVARLPGSNAMAGLVAEGAARFVSSGDELARALRDLDGARVPKSLVERVWRPGAVANFGQFVAGQLGGTGSPMVRGLA